MGYLILRRFRALQRTGVIVIAERDGQDYRPHDRSKIGKKQELEGRVD
jgi:hypothetical protein